MKYDYDMTVIIPVYNVEQYLEKSINSVIEQSYDFNKIEVILVNDASKDESAKICQKYANEYENIVFFDSEVNHGVSYSRNLGIKKARGKYLMLLDSDDYLSEKTIENLINFFDEHYDEVDLVTYPMEHIFESGRRELSKKYALYDHGDGVYDLSDYPYVDQSTINVTFKKENNIYYDETMVLGEDTKFNTMTLMKKGKIGFVKEAKYYYCRREESASRQKINPYYTFDKSLIYYEMMIDEFSKKGILHPYVQALILINICYKLKNDVLFPYHLKGKEYEDKYNRLIAVIKKIDAKTIINCDGVDTYRKFYLFKLQGKKEKVVFDKDDYKIIIDDEVAYESDRVNIMFSRFKIKNDKLNLIGTLKSPLTNVYKPDIYLSYTDESGNSHDVKMDTYMSNFSYNYTSLKYNDFYGFNWTIDLKKVKDFKFYVKIDKHVIDGKYEFEKFSSIQPSAKRYNVTSGNIKVIYKPQIGKFLITNNSFLKRVKKFIKENINYLKINPTICIYRLLAGKKKKIWLYQDRGDIHENGYLQYLHDIDKNDGIKRYYVGEKNDLNIKNFVKFKSLKHKALYFRCSKLITSFADFYEYCPFGGGYKYYSDLVNYDLIYLQHGILHAKLISMYSKEYTEIDKIVVSSNFEIDNFQKNYHYSKEDLILSGMPRMKKNEKRNTKSKKIVFAPSWRVYLIGKYIKGKRKDTKDIFLKSNFYKKINDFLNSDEIVKILERENMTLEFKLHPIFRGYKDLFTFNSKRISISFDEIDPKEYAIFITDFSSFQFDFAKLQIPIIYFMPDKEEFDAGLHSYRELDLKQEDAFGEVCYDDKELLKEIDKIIKNKCNPSKKYQKRMAEFFIETDRPCDMIYDTLIKDK